MKHLLIQYTTEGGTKITLFDAEVAEVTWSDSSTGGVRVEGKTPQQQANGGLNLLEMLTGGKNRAEEKPEAEEKPVSTKSAPRKATTRKAVEADSIEVIQAAQG